MVLKTVPARAFSFVAATTELRHLFHDPARLAFARVIDRVHFYPRDGRGSKDVQIGARPGNRRVSSPACPVREPAKLLARRTER